MCTHAEPAAEAVSCSDYCRARSGGRTKRLIWPVLLLELFTKNGKFSAQIGDLGAKPRHFMLQILHIIRMPRRCRRNGWAFRPFCFGPVAGLGCYGTGLAHQ